MLPRTTTVASASLIGSAKVLKRPPPDDLQVVGGELQVLAQDDELVTAEPGEGVHGTQRGLQPGGDPHEQPVACLVPERVVHLLDPVEVQKQHADGAGVAALASTRAVPSYSSVNSASSEE